MKATHVVTLVLLLGSPFSHAAEWFTLLDWETPQCVDSGGPITTGPIANLYEYKDTEDTGVIIAISKSTGKIGGVYFRNRGACEKHAKKYQKMWLKDRS